ncbi:hypothetical protein Moror_13033 [Moniliophthora roreri MCA 2997]|uniref:P-loop containing nucleoside triphosphate hydrolase protein n=2 Tax=Moniliophthora roreri TaxID=221103 RepID=V2XMW8_MONRO|nr:hypothetical protein Moror_13033 [Moniliophthora roreri MCA 2997]KAI3604847.1 hypothetical protein WG66_008346 [Moniliophthora roreri]
MNQPIGLSPKPKHINPISAKRRQKQLTMEPQRVLIFSHPRSMCNVLFRLLSTHPSFTPTVPGPLSFLTPSHLGPEFDNCQPEPFCSDETFQDTFDKLQKSVKEIEKTGTIPLTMEHPYLILPYTTLNEKARYQRTYQPLIQVTEGEPALEHLPEKKNPTIFPDRFFFSITSPIITIRHPARMLPSYIRAMSTFGLPLEADSFLHDMEVQSRYCWERLIFDCFRVSGRDPIIVDGEKFLEDTKGQMYKLCEALGVDESKIEYTWDPTDDRKDGLYSHFPEPVLMAFIGILHGSKGVIGRQAQNERLDLDVEERKWAEEWNEGLAGTIRELVTSSLEDYEYLLQFSI